MSCQLWLQKGWQEFAEYYHINVGHMLLFNHHRKFTFHVRIFNRSSCEINYFTLKKELGTEKEINQNVLQVMEGSRLYYHKLTDSKIHFKLSFRISRVPRKIRHSFLLGHDKSYMLRISGIGNASHLRILNIIVLFRSCHIISFYIILIFCYIACQVKCTDYVTSGRLGTNWKKFSDDNHLKVGDVCVFELVNETKKELKVTIIRNTPTCTAQYFMCLYRVQLSI